MNTRLCGSTTESRRVPAKAVDSIRDKELHPNEIDESDLQHEKHDEQRISTLRGIVIDLRFQRENAFNSARFSRESFSNETDESDSQSEKHDDQRISTLKGIITSLSQPKYRINLERDESKMNEESTTKCEFPASIEIEIFENAESLIKSTSRGIVIDSRENEKMHPIQCASVVSHSQMKWMKVICNPRNMMNNDFPHFEGEWSM